MSRERYVRRRRSVVAAVATAGVVGAIVVLAGRAFVATAADAAAGDRWFAVVGATAACYGAGVVLDAADGALARRTGAETRLGTRLDHGFDTLGFLVAPLVGVAWGRLPVWYLSLSAARYLYRAGVWVHERRGGRTRNLPESRVRRPLAALQMAFITLALPPLVPASVVHPVAAVALLPSLAVFGRDFLAVTGRWGEE